MVFRLLGLEALEELEKLEGLDELEELEKLEKPENDWSNVLPLIYIHPSALYQATASGTPRLKVHCGA